MDVIKVERLTKSFKNGSSSIWRQGSLRNNSAQELFTAVSDISFSIKKGEKVAFIGPNGAGKSTTIKMLTGLLWPTHGAAAVLGLAPWTDREALSYKIGVVFGQKSSLWYHLPPKDSFTLLAKMYGIEHTLFKKRLGQLVGLLDAHYLLEKPVKVLSLGERMRCEIIAALLNDPEILFLDEPTIGLDITARTIVRDVIRVLSDEMGVTVFLTSHDTLDIERICERALIINRGAILLDQPLASLKKQFAGKKVLKIITSEENPDAQKLGIIPHKVGKHLIELEIETDKIQLNMVINAIIKNFEVRDLSIEDPPLDEIIGTIYSNLEKTPH